MARVVAHRKGLWRARRGAGGDLGSGDRTSGSNSGKFSTPSARSPPSPMIAAAPTPSAVELMDALRIVERGDLAPADMRGAWAGKIGRLSSCRRHGSEICRRFRRQWPSRSSCTMCPTCWHRPPTTSPATAGSAARTGNPAVRTSPVIQQWNKSEVYAKTIALFCDPAVARAVVLPGLRPSTTIAISRRT